MFAASAPSGRTQALLEGSLSHLITTLVITVRLALTTVTRSILLFLNTRYRIYATT